MGSYSPDETYSIEDLKQWRFDGVGLAVLGHPVRHSISPQMHNAALAKLAKTDSRFASWRYFRFDVPPEALIEHLPLFYEKGFIGLNLTVPHKELAIEAIHAIDPHAKSIGAVNTLLKTESGYKGYNTDGHGLSRGVLLNLGLPLKGTSIALLGAGGAARAAAMQCLAEGCASLTIVNRNQDRLAKLLSELEPAAREKAIPLRGAKPDATLDLEGNELLVNATSLGLKQDDPTPIPEESLPNSIKLFDMIYNPATTRIMQCVRDRNGQAANGLSMLIHQGARSLELWSGQTAPVETMQQAALQAMA
ncbi:shikimate dehydrogenase [Pelagicoccus sp. SDUM812003]|uniref:shikimate dehydrogenase n=1 Tax=Pelagicoccus sp. SDUM812003 TaxID=3041267 RepID=UPI00280CC90D|nr:shikimate dehydrogenase [Pelagicoccus sp. SDUM812003]MDQ8203371.1 shikimate dehydrogenase [Pelagicoccus sp. SDUM812003]